MVKAPAQETSMPCQAAKHLLSNNGWHQRTEWITADFTLCSMPVFMQTSARPAQHADRPPQCLSQRHRCASGRASILGWANSLSPLQWRPISSAFACHSCGSRAVNQSMTVCPDRGKSVPGKPVSSSSACSSRVCILPSAAFHCLLL